MRPEIEHTTNAIAAAAVTSPFWLDALRQASVVAGLLVPIFGLIWLIVQIWHRINNWDAPPPSTSED